jgi:integrase
LASIQKYGKRWRAFVFRQGKRQSKVFDTKREAQDWSARAEYLILNAPKVAAAMTFGELMARYADEVSPTKRGERWEVIRLEKLQAYPLASIKLGNLSAQDFARWRDVRLREVAPASVKREMNLLSGVLTVARKEWGLIDHNPLQDVSKPKPPPARDRLVTPDELERLALSAGGDLTNATARAFHAFLFSCETAMRAGEVTGLVWARVDIARSTVKLDMTKNGTAREVPLSSEAKRLLQMLPKADPVFGLSSRQLDVLWRKLRDRAGVEGLTYHDSRHRAITQLAGKLGVLELARMVGHRDLKMLMTYYNESAEALSRKLD